MRTLHGFIFAALALLVAGCAHGGKPSLSAVKQFAEEMEQKHGLNADEVTQILQQAKFRDDIIKAISRPAEAMAWHRYRPIFLKPGRIKGGVKFWNEHTALLEEVAQAYGVPAEIIVAIVGVETYYGKNTGRYLVLDALTTLAFGYPKRAKFFRKELEEFLLLAQEEAVNPHKTKGSYAGAMGKSQFISSSYRRYAVDHDKDGKRDLWTNSGDIIASVANYFKTHRWRSGEPVTFQLANTDNLQQFADRGMKPSIPIAELMAQGATTLQPAKLDPEALTSLVELDAGEQNEYWLGLHNFYVITRYNHSNLYAMAVYQLSQEILQAKQAANSESK